MKQNKTESKCGKSASWTHGLAIPSTNGGGNLPSRPRLFPSRNNYKKQIKKSNSLQQYLDNSNKYQIIPTKWE